MACPLPIECRIKTDYTVRHQEKRRGGIMEMTKLTIRVPADVLDRAKSFAELNHTSVSRLVSHYLSRLPIEDSYLKDAPITQRLIGTLPSTVSIEDYHRYLDEKYGDAFTSSD